MAKGYKTFNLEAAKILQIKEESKIKFKMYGAPNIPGPNCPWGPNIPGPKRPWGPNIPGP